MRNTVDPLIHSGVTEWNRREKPEQLSRWAHLNPNEEEGDLPGLMAPGLSDKLE